MTTKKIGVRMPWLGELTVCATATVFSLAQWRHTAYFFGNCNASEACDMSDVVRAVQAEHGILEGYPHWRVFQSRLLGPWSEEALNVLFGSNYVLAHAIVAVVVLAIAGVVMFHAGRAIGGRQSGWSALLAFQALFTLLMSRPWLYVWDYFVLLFGAVFLLLVICRAPWWSFLFLMAAAFLNHESALFIGVWMVTKALTDAWAQRARPDGQMLAGGILGSLCGILLIENLRTNLLKREIGWELFKDAGKGPTSPFDAYFHAQLAANFDNLIQWVTNSGFDLMLLVPLPLVMAAAFAVLLVVRHGLKGAPLAAYALSQIAALLLFGVLSETRIFLQMAPFLCLGGMLIAKPEWDASSAVTPVLAANGPSGDRANRALTYRDLLRPVTRRRGAA
jgi:hypothetical protein